MSTEILAIACDQQILRSYTLPFAGSVLVRTGQEVEAGEPVAEIKMPERYQVFDVINGLKINPKNIDHHIERLVGEPVKAGDVIAQKSGLISRLFRASQDGMVVAIRDGRITMALGEKKLQVLATFPGTVVEIIPERGAVVAVQGLLLQGVWGNGLNSSGELVSLEAAEPAGGEQPAAADLQGKIAALAHIASKTTFSALLNRKPAGLVLGSVMPELLPALEQAQLPVMVLVGYGDYETDTPSKAMLRQMEGQMVYLNANEADASEQSRPDLIMPGKAQVSPGLFHEKLHLEIGRRVRLLGKPYTGSTGEIVELPVEPEKFASGLMMRAVVVRREDDLIVRIPRENVELILE
ncbi:MAG: hypothetical protein AAGU04_05170 [Anaerolineaceae bacterium]